MYLILGLALALAPRLAAPAEGPRTARTELLTYGEMMALSPAKRLAYVQDLGRLLALMETQFEGKYENEVAATEARRTRIAALLQVLAGPAEAEAATDWFATLKRWSGGSKATPTSTTERITPPNETPASAADPLATPGEPPANAAIEQPPAPGESPKGDVLPSPAFVEDKRPPKGMPSEACLTQPPACDQNLSKGQRTKLLIDFRKGPERTCIAGGFFTEKRIGGKPGSCEIKREYPFGDKKADCERPNEGLCNPFPFCLKWPGVKLSRKGKEEVTDIPVTFCVKIGQNMTERCVDKYNKIRKDGTYDRSLREFKTVPMIKKQLTKIEACDGTFTGVSTPLADAYSELRQNTIKNYQTHCAKGEGNFGQLFCKECGVVYKQIHAMLTNSGHGCDAPGASGSLTNPILNYQQPTAK